SKRTCRNAEQCGAFRKFIVTCRGQRFVRGCSERRTVGEAVDGATLVMCFTGQRADAASGYRTAERCILAHAPGRTFAIAIPRATDANHGAKGAIVRR